MAMTAGMGMQMAGGIMGGIGAGMSAAAQKRAADFRKKEAAYHAQVLEIRAKETLAVGQRAAAEAVRQNEIAQSRMLAVAAASGGSASDPTVENLVSKAAGEGAYQQAVALYSSESEARNLRNQAKLVSYQGAENAANLSSLGNATLLGGFAGGLSKAGSMYTGR